MKMQFKFQQNLDFQIDAINSVTDLFKSQKFTNDESVLIPENGIVPNTLTITDKKIQENLIMIQESNKITSAKKFEGMNFSIEMETGTGKTYVYLRTIFELFKKYGFKKFIIVVPSIAIREGVLKTLDITKTHFRELYENTPYHYYEYDSKKINLIQQFARGYMIEIMIITIDSFNKDKTIMNQKRDSLRGQKPIDIISKTKPILILDEPQNMESDIQKTALKNMGSLFTLRYSATHLDYYNRVYRLGPIEAYQKNLVKKIEVASVTEENQNTVFLRCHEIRINSNGIKARFELDTKIKTNYIRKIVWVKSGDNLYEKTNNSKYHEYEISEINAKVVKFKNGIEIKQGEGRGDDIQKLMEVQIDNTVQEHFKKFEILEKKGIKPISLFFIDRVNNYLNDNGFIKVAFDKSFNKHKNNCKYFKNRTASEVRDGYFSEKKKSGVMANDRAAFDLIMKNKERLLSFGEPVSFVFSHSALKEGWDNPNVFNICTLNHTKSNMKKRQEIGRGMRLPVDKNGDRITNEEHILTIIANESYEEYVSQLQNEYENEYGDEFKGPKPYNKRERRVLNLKKEFKLDKNFKSLWVKISQKTRYDVEIEHKKLINDCVKEINKIEIDKIKIKIKKVQLSLEKRKGVVTNFVGEGCEINEKQFPIPNMIEQIVNETGLTRNTIVKILCRIKNLNIIFRDPQEFISSCIVIINGKLIDMLVNGIQYHQIQEWYDMSLFDKIETYNDKIESSNNTIYDGVIVDSDTERSFLRELNETGHIKLFIKLPRWFIVDTPVGTYNPDWAIVYDVSDQFGKIKQRVYFVAETKGNIDSDELRDSEKRKITCAKNHFKSLKIDYRVTSNLKTMITNDKLFL